MKFKLIPGLGLGVCVLLAAPVAPASEGKGQSAAPAAQIYIDEATGRKTGPSEGEVGLKPQVSTLQVSPLAKSNPVLPASSSTPTEHANGMMSATLGEEHLEYLVMTIENGKRVIKHVENPEEFVKSHSSGEDR